MPRHYESSAARCPFYRMEDRKSVTCEGLGPNWTIKMSKDGKSGNAGGYKRRFCYDRWQECPVAVMLQARFR